MIFENLSRDNSARPWVRLMYGRRHKMAGLITADGRRGGETGVITLSETVVKIYTAEFDVTSHSACITYALTRLAARISIRQQILNANLRGDLLITRAV